MTQTIGEIPKNSMEKIIASLTEYKGKSRLDVRVHFKPNAAEDKWFPTKKGINLDPEAWKAFKELME